MRERADPEVRECAGAGLRASPHQTVLQETQTGGAKGAKKHLVYPGHLFDITLKIFDMQRQSYPTIEDIEDITKRTLL